MKLKGPKIKKKENSFLDNLFGQRIGKGGNGKIFFKTYFYYFLN
jgi:hypothetical protein